MVIHDGVAGGVVVTVRCGASLLVANGNMALVSHVKEGGGEDFCTHLYVAHCSSFIVVIEHLLLVPTSPLATWPLLLV